MIRRGLFFEDCEVLHDIFAQGRVHRLTIRRLSRSLSIWNVHNHDLGRAGLAAFITALRGELVWAQRDPLDRAVVVGGDFNFVAPGEGTLRSADQLDGHGAPRERPGQRDLQNLLGLMTDIQVDGYSHYCRAAKLFNRLHRIYVRILARLGVHAASLQGLSSVQSAVAVGKGGSDHAPFGVLFSPSRPKHPKTRPIPGFLFERPEFEPLREHYVRATGLDRLPTILRWETHKRILREVAGRVRNMVMHSQFLDPQEKLLLGNSIARAAARQNCSLARALLDSSSRARELLEIDSGTERIKDPVGFSEWIRILREGYLTRQLQERAPAAGYSGHIAKPSARSRALTRLAKLWRPLDRRLCLAGVLDPVPGAVHRAEEDNIKCLRDQWSSCFAGRPTRRRLGEALLERWAQPLGVDLQDPPGQAEIRNFLLRAMASAPGPDGLPFASWRAAGDCSAHTLARLEWWMRSGLPVPVHFGFSRAVFPPKGECEEDREEVVRAPDVPLAL